MVPTRQCERCRSWVSLDLDAELSEIQAAWVRRHLAACAQCRAFAADAAGFTALLRVQPQLAPPAPVVVSRVRTRPRGLFGAVAGLAATAAVAALALGSGLSGTDQPAGHSTRAVAAGNVDLMTLREQRIAQLHRSLRAEIGGRSRAVELDA